ncbi:MAG: response regulator [Bacteroidales bacterium]|nr:response regulator [Bacteroidales bacterium]
MHYLNSRFEWSGSTILVVEDDPGSKYYINEVLSNTGANILNADSGEMAIALVTAHPEIDLVLMDLRLPLLNGLETTKAIRKLNSDVPVIAQTAIAYYDNRKPILEAGCNEFILKPIDSVELLLKINQYLSEKQESHP